MGHHIAFEIDLDIAERARQRIANTQPPLFVMPPQQIEMEWYDQGALFDSDHRHRVGGLRHADADIAAVAYLSTAHTAGAQHIA